MTAATSYPSKPPGIRRNHSRPVSTPTEIDGVSVRVFSAGKTIADCFQYRNKLGLDVPIEALRLYRERNGRKGMKSILQFAEVDRVKPIILPYLEAIPRAVMSQRPFANGS